MFVEDLVQLIESRPSKADIVRLPVEAFTKLTWQEADALARRFQSDTIIELPPTEVKFFEWLRSADPGVWQDLWGSNDAAPVYSVAISFLPLLLDTRKGFPICDLVDELNYYFTDEHILEGEGTDFVTAVRERFTSGDSLTIEQLLALEISVGPIDIWHFAYHHDIPVDRAKRAAKELSADNIVVHLTQAEYLAPFLRFGQEE